MDDEQKLKEKILKEQDLTCLYAMKMRSSASDNSAISNMENYAEEPRVRYCGLAKFILSHEDMWQEFSTDNLIRILCRVTRDDEEKRSHLVETIMKRLETEPFFCEDVESNFYMQILHSYTVTINRLGLENFEKIKQGLLERLQPFKRKMESRVIKAGITDFMDLANFLHYAEAGVFTEEKVAFIEQMTKRKPQALRYFHFGLMQDAIYLLGENFVEYISRFPSKSQELVALAKVNPALFQILGTKIGQYSENLPDHYREIEILLEYFNKQAFQVEAADLSQGEIEELIDSAFANHLKQKNYERVPLVTVPYQKNYTEKLQQEIQAQYENATSLEQKRNLCMNRLFGVTTQYAKNFLKDYASDLENVSVKPEVLDYCEEIRKLLSYETIEEIDQAFSAEGICHTAREIVELQQTIAKSCTKTFSEQLQTFEQQDQPEEIIEFEGKQIRQIRVNGDFNLLIHSTDTGFITKRGDAEEIDYTTQWKSGKNGGNHIISASYINQDFMGHAPVRRKWYIVWIYQVKPRKYPFNGYYRYQYLLDWICIFISA